MDCAEMLAGLARLHERRDTDDQDARDDKRVECRSRDEPRRRRREPRVARRRVAARAAASGRRARGVRGARALVGGESRAERGELRRQLTVTVSGRGSTKSVRNRSS